MNPKGLQLLVSEFHRKYGYPHENNPDFTPQMRMFRLQLISEEFAELVRAIKDGNTIEIADALGDLEYVVNGTAVTFALPLTEIVEEIHRSNMTKIPDRDNADKPIKGPGFSPPDIYKVLYKSTNPEEEHGW